jgi:hypothetical protein
VVDAAGLGEGCTWILDGLQQPDRRVFSLRSTADAPVVSQILDLLRMTVGVMFVRVNSKCAHQVRPPLGPVTAPYGVCRVARY